MSLNNGTDVAAVRESAATETSYQVAEPAQELVVAEQRTGRPRVLIIGAGFGGLSAARELARHDVDVLMLDRNNYHGFWPLLYQVATAELEPESIAYPVRAILRKYPNVNFQMAEVRGVDLDRKQVQTEGEPISYDYLILAAGSANNYFGNDSLAQYTYSIKDIDDAERLRNHVLTCFEQAVREHDPERRQALMTVVIVGAGPTGVELAGAYAELIRQVLKKDFPMLDVSQARVVLIEAIDRVLSSFPESLQRNARKRLEAMGVEVRLNTPVASVDDQHVTFKDGTKLAASTVVWSAGVRGAQIADTLGIKLGRGARVPIEPTLNLPGRREVFAVGDIAHLESVPGGGAYAMVAPVAIQQGKLAAQNIIANEAGKPLGKFRYFDKGQMATIGRRAAVLSSFGIRLTGRLAWIGWLFIHLIELIGFRNRIIVLTNWAYNYFTYDRGVRLITSRER